MVRDDATARARRGLLRKLAGNVAAAVAAVRDNFAIVTANTPRAALA